MSHDNEDFRDERGRNRRHCDGNRRVLMFGAVVRALIHPKPDATCKAVFADSPVEKAIAAGDSGIIDVHRDGQRAEDRGKPADKQSILL